MQRAPHIIHQEHMDHYRRQITQCTTPDTDQRHVSSTAQLLNFADRSRVFSLSWMWNIGSSKYSERMQRLLRGTFYYQRNQGYAKLPFPIVWAIQADMTNVHEAWGTLISASKRFDDLMQVYLPEFLFFISTAMFTGITTLRLLLIDCTQYNWFLPALTSVETL